MTVQRRSIFAQTAIDNPTGDLGMEGTTSPYPATSGGLGNESAHGDVAAYHTAKANACGEKPGQSAGFALFPNGFSTGTGDGGHGDHDADTPSNSSGYGKGIAGEDSFSSHGYKDSDAGSDRSGYGKGIAGTDPFSRHDSI